MYQTSKFLNRLPKPLPCFFLQAILMSLCFCSFASSQAPTSDTQPTIEDYATIEAYVGDVPVYAFGYTYVYSIGPDLLPGTVMQRGNTNPAVKFKPKKSWEIEENLLGSTPAREPKTMWNDDQPLLPIHLIDGDPETAWSSRGGKIANRQPEWIRIDLPIESTVASVALVCSKVGPGARQRFGRVSPGKALPGQLTIKLATDGLHWQTVYENNQFSGNDSGPTVMDFKPQNAKQIWIIADNLPRVSNWGHAISIGQVEVRDPNGNNLALVSRGSGVQVSSTYYGYGMDRFTQDLLWPIQYDMGYKWTRVGYDMGVFLWSYVEREKGKLQVDSKADAAITQATRNGINVIMVLDEANWLYHDPPRKVDWKKARITEMMEAYYDVPGWPNASEKMLQGWLRYADYMARHFKGRVAYWEICNGTPDPKTYHALFKPTADVIRKADPNARICLGTSDRYPMDNILRLLGKKKQAAIRDGKFEMHNQIFATVKDLEINNITISVDAKSSAEAGIILRANDEDSCWLARYSPQDKAISFRQRHHGYWPNERNKVAVDDLDENIHLTAQMAGSKVTFTVSDSKKSFTTEMEIKRLLRPGLVGLFQPFDPPQQFDNFIISKPDGSIVFEDNFDHPDGPAPNWVIGTHQWVNPEKIGPQLDMLGWHNSLNMDNPDWSFYDRQIRQFKKECAELGFKGHFITSEFYWGSAYPGGPVSEIVKAKGAAQESTLLSGLDVISLYNETFQTGKIDWDCSLVRNAFQSDPISSTQPQPIYYVLRNLSTVMDGFRAHSFPAEFSNPRKFHYYTFKHKDNRQMLAAWMSGPISEELAEAETDITLPGIHPQKAWVIDILNGTKQELSITYDGKDTKLKAMLIKDYPVFITFKN